MQALEFAIFMPQYTKSTGFQACAAGPSQMLALSLLSSNAVKK